MLANFRDISGKSMWLPSHWTYIDWTNSLRDYLRSFTKLLNIYVGSIHLIYLFTLMNERFVSEHTHQQNVNG